MRILIATITLGFSLIVWAQHSEQPQQESSSDLRNQSQLFILELPELHKIYALEKTPNLDYFLRFKQGTTESIQKIDTDSAKKMDRDFAHRFLKCQYELPSVSGDCKVVYKLSLKGEGQEICEKDDKKSREMAEFVEKILSKRF